LSRKGWQTEFAQGIRRNDPAFGIQWLQVDARISSAMDQQYPDFIL